MIKDDRLNAFLFVVAPSCIPCPTLAFTKTSGTDGLEEGKKTSEGKREWVKRQKRELKSCISRQTVEMKRRCLQTEDKPSVTAARGSHLCQCLDDLLQCYNTLENRRTETKFTIQGRGSEIFFSFFLFFFLFFFFRKNRFSFKSKHEEEEQTDEMKKSSLCFLSYKNVTRKLIIAIWDWLLCCSSLPPTECESDPTVNQRPPRRMTTILGEVLMAACSASWGTTLMFWQACGTRTVT